jgi:hypothetical protein
MPLSCRNENAAGFAAFFLLHGTADEFRQKGKGESTADERR